MMKIRPFTKNSSMLPLGKFLRQIHGMAMPTAFQYLFQSLQQKQRHLLLVIQQVRFADVTVI